jgi:hypothetical protein
MKSYAKTLPGSVYSVDRRTDSQPTGVGQITDPALAAQRGEKA